MFLVDYFRLESVDYFRLESSIRPPVFPNMRWSLVVVILSCIESFVMTVKFLKSVDVDGELIANQCAEIVLSMWTKFKKVFNGIFCFVLEILSAAISSSKLVRFYQSFGFIGCS